MGARSSIPGFICLIGCIAFGQVVALAALQRRAEKQKPEPVELLAPSGLAFDREGNLFISDIEAHSIFRLGRRGKLTVIAGTGSAGFNGDGRSAIGAQLHAPHDLTFDEAGNLLIADTGNQRIRRIERDGAITTIAGNGKAGPAGAAGVEEPALNASFNNPQSIALDRDGNLLIADTYNHVIRRLDRRGVIMTIAGTVPGYGGDGGPAAKAQINLPMAVAVGPDQSIYLSDGANSRIRLITIDGMIRTILGYGPAQDTYGAGFAGDGGPPEKAKIFTATDLKFDHAGNLYICDSGNHRIRMIRHGIVTTIAGNGQMGTSGDGGKASSAELNTPQKIIVSADGAVFISDRANRRIRKVDSAGTISTIAGKEK